MKNYIYISMITSMAFLASCDGRLDIVPKDVIDAEIAVTSLEDLEDVLLGTYSTLRRDGLYGESLFYLPDLMSDNLRVGDSNGGALRTEANWQYSAGDDINTWEDSYTVIFRANTVINNIDRFEDGGQKNRILGQALALRALSHFDLLRYYAPEYNRNSNALGVPIILAFEIGKPARSTVSEVYDQILMDLLTARDALGDVDEDPQEDGPFFFNLMAVNALLARVYLYAEQWEDAAGFASLVINSGALSDPDEYVSMWTDDADGEVLFSVVYTTPDDGRIATTLFDVSITRSTFTITQDLADLYDRNNDIRYSTFIRENPDSNPGDDLFLPVKYPGRGGERGLNNAKVFRMSEMYLIRAESNTNIPGMEKSALFDLNTLRAARINNYNNVSLSGAGLSDAIQEERRKELAIEGHRWFDLRRTSQNIRRGIDCRGLTVNCTLDAGDTRFVFPIPQDEIFANENIIQNEGYN